MRIWLREERIKLGLTQQQIAEKVGISRSFYTQIETQFKNKGVSVKTAKKLGNAMNFEWTKFF